MPHSVRFGRRDEVWLDLGGAEALNGKHGNVEDVLELDESSRDGDTDMVLYFSTLASGIAPEDEEACVKGIWADGSGQEYKFFGCDSIATESSPWPKATAAEATTPVTPTHELYLPHTAK